MLSQRQEIMIYYDYKDAKITASLAKELLGLNHMQSFRDWLDKMDERFGKRG
jgi:hypothetical protein